MAPSRKTFPQLRRFERIAAAVVIGGLPLALAAPGSLPGKFYAVLALPIIASGAASADAWLKRRKATPPEPTLKPGAPEAPGKHNLHLLDGGDLVAKRRGLAPEKSAALLKRALEGEFWKPTCPACGVKMAPRSASRYAKKYGGCINHPRCGQTFGG